MATTITNRASLRYTYGDVTETVASNLASTVLNDPLTVAKSSLEAAYRSGEDITYIITVTNGSDIALPDVTITDDLGTFTTTQGVSVTPLTYTGPAKLYIDGVYVREITPTVEAYSVAFPIGQIAPTATATILYRATPNEYAPMTGGAAITNTASFTPAAAVASIEAPYTLPADAYAAVTVDKSMSPNPISDGAALVNTFTITNTGNLEATDLVLTDTFQTPLADVVVAVNGVTVPETDYTFTGNTLTLPAPGAATTISVPAAAFTQDETTGAVAIVPGVTTVTVTGTI